MLKYRVAHGERCILKRKGRHMRKSLLIGLLMLGVGASAVQAQERASAWNLFCRGNSSGEVRVVLTFEDDTRKVVQNHCTPGSQAQEEWPTIPAARGNVARVKALIGASNESAVNTCTYTTDEALGDRIPCKAQYGTGDQVELFFSIPPVQ